MDRSAFLRGLAAGCPPTLSSQDLASELDEMATYDDIRAGDAEILRQAAARLALAMTPQEIRERLKAAAAACGASHGHVDIYSFGNGNTVSGCIYISKDAGSLDASGPDWRGVLDELSAKAVSCEWTPKIIDGHAKTLIAGGKLSETDEARYGERARTRAREMAEGFMKGAAE